MPLYQYTAVDESGAELRGQMEAASEGALESALSHKGQWLAKAHERQVSATQSARLRGDRVVPRRALIELFLQLHLQLRSGVPLLNALSFGLEGGGHVGLRIVQRDVLERVRAGASFSEALAAHPRTFAPLVVNLIRAGESSGRLAESCGELRRYYEWLDRLMGDVRQALIYPVVVLCVTTVFFFVMFTTLIPRFAAVLLELKVRLPVLTRLLLDTSWFLTHYGWVIGTVLALVIVALKWGPRWSRRFGRALDAIKLRLPIFGSLLHLLCQSRLAQNLATLYGSGVPLLESLRLCRPLVGNRVMEEAVEELQAGVNAGRPLHEVMKENLLFSRLMVQMVAVGEGSGTLGESLQHVADYYNDVVPRQVKKFLTLLEPAMILALIGLVGIVALGVFLPIADMLGAK
ncbi:MAG TPA: type II secretion system F family protein [Verrucomicrobiae bacterium]|nr:type II secretion system F family protein [Verrucomicrobiae bacterium]